MSRARRAAPEGRGESADGFARRAARVWFAHAFPFHGANNFAPLVVLSALLHALAFALLLAGGAWRALPAPAPLVVRVDLVAAAPMPALVPTRESVLLPEKARAPVERFAAPDAPAPQQSLEELLAAFQQERPEVAEVLAHDAAQPTREEMEAALDAARAEASQRSRAEQIFAARARTLVERNWSLITRLQHLSARASVNLDATGAVLGVEILRSSGNRFFDQSVEQAFFRASPLPAPPEPGAWEFEMDPRK